MYQTLKEKWMEDCFMHCTYIQWKMKNEWWIALSGGNKEEP